jgi:hypothetical protein
MNNPEDELMEHYSGLAEVIDIGPTVELLIVSELLFQDLVRVNGLRFRQETILIGP